MTSVTLTRSIPTLHGDLPAGLALFVISWGLNGDANLADSLGRQVVSMASAESFKPMADGPGPLAGEEEFTTETRRHGDYEQRQNIGTPDTSQTVAEKARESVRDSQHDAQSIHNASPQSLPSDHSDSECANARMEGGAPVLRVHSQAIPRGADPDPHRQEPAADVGDPRRSCNSVLTEECPFEPNATPLPTANCPQPNLDPNVELSLLSRRDHPSPSQSARQVTAHSSRYTSDPSITPNVAVDRTSENGARLIVIPGEIRPHVIFIPPERWYDPERLQALNSEWHERAMRALGKTDGRAEEGSGESAVGSREEKTTAHCPLPTAVSQKVCQFGEYPEPSDSMTADERRGHRRVEADGRTAWKFGPDISDFLPMAIENETRRWREWVARLSEFFNGR